MAIVDFTPNMNNPRFSSLVYETRNPVTYSASPATVAVSDLLGGLLIDALAGAMTLNLPSASAINAAIPAPVPGATIKFYVRNTGNNTGTVAVGAGGTSASGNTLTVATLNTREFILQITSVATPSVVGSVDAYTLYSIGVSAH